MEAIICVVLSGIVIRQWYKGAKEEQTPDSRRNTVKNKWDRERRRAKNKHLTDEELIAVVLPTLREE